MWSLCGVWTSDSEKQEEGGAGIVGVFVLLFDIAAISGPKLQDTHPQLTQRRTGYSYRYLYTGIYSYLKVSKYLSI